jgi:hypothetical protein
MWVGLRPGELYGLHGHRVNWLRGTVEVIEVMTRNGLRQWPKSKKSHRVVPVPEFVMDGMSACMTGRARDALLFTAPEGGPINDANLRTRSPGMSARWTAGNAPAIAHPTCQAGEGCRGCPTSGCS